MRNFRKIVLYGVPKIHYNTLLRKTLYLENHSKHRFQNFGFVFLAKNLDRLVTFLTLFSLLGEVDSKKKGLGRNIQSVKLYFN